MSLFKAAAAAFAPRDHAAEVFAALEYEPTEKQSLFHQATEYDVLYGGARGGGKTRALVVDDILDCFRFPGIRIGSFRRTFGELEESVFRELQAIGYAEVLGGKWNDSKKELRFKNKSVIRFGYAENVVDASRRQGGQWQKLSLDDRSLMSPGVVDRLREQLRSGDAAIPVIGIRSSSNPGGPDHAALKARFITPTDYGRETYVDEHGHTVRFIAARLRDNPHMDAGYEKTLEAAIVDPNRRRAMLDGDWDALAGAFFPEWNRTRHVVPASIELDPSWRRYAGIDYGYRAPWAVVWGAEDEDGRLWIYRERYQTGVGESEQAKEILEAESADNEWVMRYADDSMWSARGSARSIADIYAAMGCHIMPSHKGARLNGWQRVHTYLADAPACLHHREQGLDQCPLLHVLDGRAPKLIEEIVGSRHDETKVEDLNTKDPDHAVDALRYLCINLGRRSADEWLDPEPADAEDEAVETIGEYVGRLASDDFHRTLGSAIDDEPWGTFV